MDGAHYRSVRGFLNHQTDRCVAVCPAPSRLPSARDGEERFQPPEGRRRRRRRPRGGADGGGAVRGAPRAPEAAQRIVRGGAATREESIAIGPRARARARAGDPRDVPPRRGAALPEEGDVRAQARADDAGDDDRGGARTRRGRRRRVVLGGGGGRARSERRDGRAVDQGRERPVRGPGVGRHHRDQGGRHEGVQEARREVAPGQERAERGERRDDASHQRGARAVREEARGGRGARRRRRKRGRHRGTR